MAKLQYKSKIEDTFHCNNLKAVWDGMKAMTSQQNTYNRPISIDGFNSNIASLQMLFNDKNGFTHAQSDLFDV